MTLLLLICFLYKEIQTSDKNYEFLLNFYITIFNHHQLFVYFAKSVFLLNSSDELNL